MRLLINHTENLDAMLAYNTLFGLFVSLQLVLIIGRAACGYVIKLKPLFANTCIYV